MSSVQSYIKQQNRVYGVNAVSSSATLNLFDRIPFDPSNPNSTLGSFQSTSSFAVSNTAAGLTPVFRDMGEVIRSAGRTFRRVQMLTQSPATFGVQGVPSTNAQVNSYRTFWYEVSLLDGQGIIGPLFQVQG